jgi:hypothetical protein
MRTIFFVMLLSLAAFPSFSKDKSFAEKYLDLRKEAPDGEIKTLIIPGKTFIQNNADATGLSLPPEEREKTLNLLKKVKDVTLIVDGNFPGLNNSSGMEALLRGGQEELFSFQSEGMKVSVFTDGDERINNFTLFFSLGELFGISRDNAPSGDELMSREDNATISMQVAGVPLKVQGPAVCIVVHMRFMEPIPSEDILKLLKTAEIKPPQSSDSENFHGASRGIEVSTSPVFSVVVDGITLYFKGGKVQVLSGSNVTHDVHTYTQLAGAMLIAPPDGSKYDGEVVIPTHVTNNGVTYPVVSVGFKAFQGSAVTSVTLPQGLRAIELFAFDDCSALKSVVFPNSLTSIGLAAFQGCMNLEDVQFPQSLIYVGSSAFNACVALKSVHLPSRVASVGEHAFSLCNMREFRFPDVQVIASGVLSNCKALESVIIPGSVTSIEKDVLYNNPALKSITILAKEPPALEAVFFWNKDQVTVHVPGASIDKYKQARGWKDMVLVGD